MAQLRLKDMTTQSSSCIMVPRACARRCRRPAGRGGPHRDDLGSGCSHPFREIRHRPMMQQKAEMIPFIEKEIVRWGKTRSRGRISGTQRLQPPRADFTTAAASIAAIAPLKTAASGAVTASAPPAAAQPSSRRLRRRRQPRGGLAAAELAAFGLDANQSWIAAADVVARMTPSAGTECALQPGKGRGLRSAARRGRLSPSAPPPHLGPRRHQLRGRSGALATTSAGASARIATRRLPEPPAPPSRSRAITHYAADTCRAHLWLVALV